MSTPHASSHPKFLLATDRSSAAAPHLAYAVRLGNRLGARCTLFHALRPPQVVVHAAMDGDETPVGVDASEARRALIEFVATLPADRPVHVAVDQELDGAAAILAAAERIAADVIVLPSHGRTGLKRAVLGSTAEQVMRRSTRPVLILTDRMLAHERVDPEEKGPMLIATDLSPDSVAALRPAVAMAERLGLGVVLLSAFDDRAPPPYGGGAPVAPPPRDERGQFEQHLRELRRYATEFDAAVPIEVAARSSHAAADTIVAEAEKFGAPLLALTTHGRRGIARLVQGSVAERVVRHATVPVLVMPQTEG